jgi:endonuclease/exonuclease/phosphatase family metal-dependent hydrolase
MIRVLTLNTWHGHTPKNAWSVHRLEPHGHKARRMEALSSALDELRPDVVMFQECLPQPIFAADFARLLGYDHVSKVCNSGLRLFGVGLPAGIGPGEGVSILARRGLGLRALGIDRLSGIGYTSPHVAIQFGQLRFAMAAEVHVGGARVVLINTHLRYAYPKMATFERSWRELASRGHLHGDPSKRLVSLVQKSMRVRDAELGRFERFIARFVREGAHVIVGADFNLDHDTDQMLRFGSNLELLNVLPTIDARALTWDPDSNTNIAFSTRMSHPDGTPKNTTWKLAAHYDSVPQNPDHLLLGPSFTRASLKDGGLAMHRPSGGVLPSDHYGVWAEIAIP